YVNLLQAQRLDEGDGVGAHPLERRRDLAGTAGDARVVEQDHLTVASEAIRHRRVPIIHGADVVLVEDDRHTAGLAESAIGEADSVSLNELCRRGLVSMNHCGRSLYHLVGTASDTSARAAFAQSMSFCTVGAPLSPIAPTTSPFTLMGNPPPHAAIRASVGMPGQKRRVALDKVEKLLRGDAEQSCVCLVLGHLSSRDRGAIHPAKGLEISAVIENRYVLANAKFSGFRHRCIHHFLC